MRKSIAKLFRTSKSGSHSQPSNGWSASDESNFSHGGDNNVEQGRWNPGLPESESGEPTGYSAKNVTHTDNSQSQTKSHLKKPQPDGNVAPSGSSRLSGKKVENAEKKPVKKRSINTLRKKYKKFSDMERFQKQCEDVIDYVACLEEDKKSTAVTLNSLQENLKYLTDTFSEVSIIIEGWKPEQHAQFRRQQGVRPATLSQYVQMIHEHYDKQSGRAAELDKIVRDRDAEIKSKADQIVQLEMQNKRNQQDHKEEIDGINNMHNGQVQSLTSDHTLELEKKEREHQDFVFSMRKNHNVEKTRLQNALLTTVDGFKPMTDASCNGQLDDLRDNIHTLAFILEFRPERHGHLIGPISYMRNPRGKEHKTALEGLFWNIIFTGVFETPFRVFGDYGESFMLTWSQLFARSPESHSNSSVVWPVADSRSETWRYVTFETLQRGLDERSPVKRVIKSFETNASTVRAKISELYSQISSQDKQADIYRIVDKACRLALEIGKQRCRFQLFAPQPNDTISVQDTASFETLNPFNESNITIPEVLLAIRPGLKKIGDGRGGSFNNVANLRTAAVYLKTTN